MPETLELTMVRDLVYGSTLQPPQPPTEGFLQQADGLSYILQADGVSKIIIYN